MHHSDLPNAVSASDKQRATPDGCTPSSEIQRPVLAMQGLQASAERLLHTHVRPVSSLSIALRIAR